MAAASNMSKLFIDGVHAQNVLQRMWEQTERKEFCDISLIAGETQISAHRAVLSASSEYFETMFRPPFNESTAKEVKLTNVDGESLKSLVKFCYSGRLEMSEDNAEKLLITADSLLLEPVVNACGDFLAEQLDPTNCLGMAQLAERHHCELLSEKAKQFCLKRFVDLYKTDEFLNLTVEQLTQLLSSDDLCDPTEEHVFKSLMIWIEHDRSKREQHKDEMLKLVRLPLLDPSFLLEHVQPVCTSPASLQLCMKAAQWHLVPETRTVNASEFTKPRRSGGERLMAIKIENMKLNILYYCPKLLKWMKWLENMAYRENFGVAVMEDELFMVGGGSYTPFFYPSSAVNTVISLNLKTMILKRVNPMIQRRRSPGVVVINGFLYAVGGHNGNNIDSTVERWDCKSNTWEMVASMSVGRSCFGCTVFNGKIYVMGGEEDEEDDEERFFECYNPQENVWTTFGSTNDISYPSLSLVVANGMLYAVSVEELTIERYDPETNQWTVVCDCSTGINACATFNNKVTILYNDRVEEYNSTSNECKVNASIKGLEKTYHIFSFCGSLLESKFIEN